MSMPALKTVGGGGIAALTLVLSQACSAQNVSASSPGADNTRANQVAAAQEVETADGQSNARRDLEITQRIRRTVMADDSLSTYAHNIKIVTVRGKVTLSGVVRSEDEKNIVAATAAQAAGTDSIVNNLTVAAP